METVEIVLGDRRVASQVALGEVLAALARGTQVQVIDFHPSSEWNTPEEQFLRVLGVEWWARGPELVDRTDNLGETVARLALEEALAALRPEAQARCLLILQNFSDAVLHEVEGWRLLRDRLLSRSRHTQVLVTAEVLPPDIIKIAHRTTHVSSNPATVPGG